ncbi:hypothetical protein PGTUg99_008891 [Puccinia graminis f. sp. tritici]|uniref:Uncharacterized protein n=1 Tax=Puccinia graminis f. sp. tritici TaxID=56615 RepID=A0A5B0PEA5_PUCGR|nr:hypothetical protein PGTUg99_008891 [Puccinia graminis f. sp. tritici]
MHHSAYIYRGGREPRLISFPGQVEMAKKPHRHNLLLFVPESKLWRRNSNR